MILPRRSSHHRNPGFVRVSDMSDIDLQRPSPDVALLTLNRPEKLNALSFDLVEDLHGALDDVGSDNSVRVLILTGAGRGFCSGLDLTALGPSPAAAGT